MQNKHRPINQQGYLCRQSKQKTNKQTNDPYILKLFCVTKLSTRLNSFMTITLQCPSVAYFHE